MPCEAVKREVQKSETRHWIGKYCPWSGVSLWGPGSYFWSRAIPNRGLYSEPPASRNAPTSWSAHTSVQQEAGLGPRALTPEDA